MLSRNMQKTIDVLREAQRQDQPLDMDEIGVILRLLCLWQGMAAGLEGHAQDSPRKLTPARGHANWKPHIVGGTDQGCPRCDLSRSEVLAHVLT